MPVIFTEEECALEFPGGAIVRLDNSTGGSMESINDVIDRKIGSYCDIYSYNGGMSVVIEVLNKYQIKFSICSEFSMINRGNHTIKPLFEITVAYYECIDALIQLRETRLLK